MLTTFLEVNIDPPHNRQLRGRRGVKSMSTEKQLGFKFKEPATLPEKDWPLIVMPYGWCPVNDRLPEGVKAPIKIIIAKEVGA